MDLWSIDKLQLFLAFVIPGFIAIKVYQLIFPGSHRSSSEQIIDAIAYSCMNYAVLMLPIYWVESVGLSNVHPKLYVLFYFAVIFISPVVLVFIWARLRAGTWMLKNAPHPTSKPWDFVFSQRKPYWIKVVMKNGDLIGGLYAGDSFASSAPYPEQIYLEETWVLNENGGFTRKKNDTEGVLILSSEISHIELRKWKG